ncbi:MAG: hypothetical protein H7255_20945 [Ramlibacter sp.]|nr:hypothetical protein [Ramlibacter sp.]
MNNLFQTALTSGVLSLALVLSACGGGEAERVTVSTTVPHAQPVQLPGGLVAFPAGLEPN